MNHAVWEACAQQLKQELSSQQFNTWIRPLVAEIQDGNLSLLAPNRFILDWVNQKFLRRIHELVFSICSQENLSLRGEITVKVNKPVNSSHTLDRQSGQSTGQQAVTLEAVPSVAAIASQTSVPAITSAPSSYCYAPPQQAQPMDFDEPPTGLDEHSGYSGSAYNNEAYSNIDGIAHNSMAKPHGEALSDKQMSSQANIMPFAANPASNKSDNFSGSLKHDDGMNPGYTFGSFVEGKSNQLGLAAAQQVVENPGESYNPLFIYGGVGLGKTHLMQAVGNAMRKRNPNAKILYLHSERFLADMVKAINLGAVEDFKRYYRSADALLIDDIQFIAGKERTQELFFHTFNDLLHSNRQIILTCDRYPKAIANLEERLKSRFGWGLTVEVEPPELETRVAILMKFAEKAGVDLPSDAAFFIGQKIRSNVRELEGAMKRVLANANFTHRPITVELVREALKDLLALQDKQVNITNIQRVVGEYYKIKVAEFTSKRRSRSVARPRQMAMALAKELTNHSLPEIGDAFGGRDHTTVLHAVRKIKELCSQDSEMEQDWLNLQRTLTT